MAQKTSYLGQPQEILHKLLYPKRLHDGRTKAEEKYIKALDVAATLGTIPVNLAYHNHHHAREVTLICQELLALQAPKPPRPFA